MRRTLERCSARLLLVMVALVLLSLTSALAGEPVRHFRSYGLSQGLSQATVMEVAQDGQGFLWVGTQDGLNRFDGYEFRTYRHVPGLPTSLGSSYVTALATDESGQLWVGTLGGLDRYDPATDSFVHISIDALLAGEHSVLGVHEILQDQQGRLWVGTSRGLARLDPGAGALERIPLGDGTSEPVVYALAEDLKGGLWVGTTRGLHRLHPASGEVESFRHEPERADSLPDDSVADLCMDDHGRLWVGTRSGGLARYQELTRGFVQVGPLLSDIVRAVLSDSQGRIWAGAGEVLVEILPDTGQIRTTAADPADPRSLSHGRVLSLFEDESGLLWVGTHAGGLDVYDPRTEVFEHLRQSPGGLGSSVVYAVHEDSGGDLWVGTMDAGLFRVDGLTGEVRSYAPMDGEGGVLEGAWVKAIASAPGTDVWVGTQRALHRVDPVTHEVTVYRHDPDDPGGLSSGHIRALQLDGAGSLWIGTAGGGVMRMDLAQGSLEHHRSRVGDPSTLADDTVRGMHLDRQGRLWVGHYGQGLSVLDTSTGVVTRFSHDPEVPTSLGSDFIRCIFIDSVGGIWVGTDMGVSRLDWQAGRFIRYGREHGLPSDVVYGILEDARGDLWMSSNGGLVRFDPEEERSQIFTSADGLQGDEFNTGAYAQGASGRMYFGGPGGLTSFDPEEVRPDDHQPAVVITDVLLFNRSAWGLREDVLPVAPPVAREIVLEPEDQMVAVEFAALGLRQPEDLDYAYLLEGFHEDWVSTDALHRRATFTALPPGSYRLRVKATNADGLWSEREAILGIRVLPAWWQTWTFRILAGALVLGGLLSWILLRQEALRQRNAHLERVVEERTRDLRDRTAEAEESARQIEARLAELRASNRHIRKLEGLLPICASCKKIRVEGADTELGESWVAIEEYITERTDADFSHGICPSCIDKLYPDLAED